MTHIRSSKLAASSSSGISDSVSAAALKTDQPVVVTKVDPKHNSLERTTLADLFSGSVSGNTARVCFYVAGAGAARDACRQNKKSSKGGWVYAVQFLCKDVSTQSNNNVYKILLYTHDGLGTNFFKQAATDLGSDSKAAAAVTGAFGTLTRFNSWVDAVVERRNGYWFIKDTRMVY